MKKAGLIINPIAGMGGSVGLKGTDHMVEEARKRGAVPQAALRVRTALNELLPLREELLICTWPGDMGGDLAKEMGFETLMLGEKDPGASETDATDTMHLARKILNEQADLLIFAGGDGTARDIYQAVELSLPCIGIPAGVKIHSPVYAKNPKAAGQLAKLWLTGQITKTAEEEVLDIDEEEYRKEIINTKLYGYLPVPREKMLIQSRKAPTPLSDTAAIESIAHEVVGQMEDDTYYLIGAGTTTRGIMQMLGLKNTLIGVDLIYNKNLVAKDVYGDKILSHIKGKKCRLVVTVTGGQGFLFGRGNQQLTSDILREIGKDRIMILATKAKLAALRGNPLLVDTSDEELNRSLCGYYRTITGYGEYTMCCVSEI